MMYLIFASAIIGVLAGFCIAIAWYKEDGWDD
jgi:hypothetical protein